MTNGLSKFKKLTLGMIGYVCTLFQFRIILHCFMIDITKSESCPCYSSSDCRTVGLGEREGGRFRQWVGK